MKKYDVIIIGGGLAGLTAAINLSKEGLAVILIEKKQYPHHKVCGEYVSNEVTPYLESLGVSIEALNAKTIDTLLLSSVKGKSMQTKLPLGGFGISRYAFDYAFYQKALDNNVDFIFDTVANIHYEDEMLKVFTENNSNLTSSIVIGAYGKRNALDKSLQRRFIQKKSSWLGVKAHYQFEDFPENMVALHNFEGGYGGLSKTETGAVNFCYLASYESFQKEKNIEAFNANVVGKNPYLRHFLREAKPIFNEPMTIAQISFKQKPAVENHVLMCGDTAGLIHPLCGNGMAMAIHSAKIASEGIIDYFNDMDRNRSVLENTYQSRWNKEFRKRLWVGRQLQSLFLNKTMSQLAIEIAITSPSLLRSLIKNTHGKEIQC